MDDLDYGGISAERLEILEERLKDDVIAESNAFGGRYATNIPDAHKILNTHNPQS